ncbi:MAG: hypothetical protein AB8G16_08755 [Gammaproteobacteria bacterium]
MSSHLAVVPCRAGSKRLVNKNRRDLGGKPLLTHSVEQALAADIFDHVVVSTEDETLAQMGRDAGADVPFLRPPDLAQDSSSIEDVLHNLLQTLDAKFDSLTLLQPTSPFRKVETIRAAHALFLEHGDSVITLCQVKGNAGWLRTVDTEGFVDAAYPESSATLFIPNGGVYIAKPADILERGELFSQRPRALVITDPMESLDVDTVEEWNLVQYAAAGKHSQH